MTTIAANSKYIAADTYCSVTNTNKGFHASKITRCGSTVVACAGPSTVCHQFIEWRRGGKPPKFASVLFEALVLDASGLYLFVNSVHPDRVLDGRYAIGSGGPYALGALAFGATPKAAVEFACSHDCYSKPPVEVTKL